MPNHPASATETYQPPTFRLRGVLVPATTPLLAGTRVRSGPHKGIEFVVPNLSGERGTTIVPFAAIHSVYSPTIHDTVLLRSLAQLKLLSPTTVRRAALRVAAEGYAGREAASAAEQKLAEDRTQRRKTHAVLIANLAEETGFGGLTHDQAARAWQQADLTAWTDRLLGRLSGSLGRPPAQLAAGLQVLLDAAKPVGLPPHEADARCPRLILRLRTTEAALVRWVEDDPTHDVAGLGLGLAATLQTMAELATALLHTMRQMFASPLGLLKQWVADPQAMAQAVTRCEWLLDGWDPFCLLWLLAETEAARRTALLEMPSMLPVLPQELTEWIDAGFQLDALGADWRVAIREDNWRIGAAALPLIERNEMLCARAL